jgi:hypothetical protein
MKRWGLDMSFVTAAPEEVQAAAQNLAGIRSMLVESSASVAPSTAAVVAAAEDEVSAQVAALFGAFGQQYQVISAQAQAFHAEFVNLMSAGAGAYLSTELANAQQDLLNAVNPPVQGLLGQSAGASRAMGAAASGLTAARTAALPLLGRATSVGSILGTGAPLGQSINGVVTALHNGTAMSLLPGQIGAVSQSLSGGIAGLPGLAPAASTGLASIAGPYRTLFANTVADLQTLESAIAANPAPFLRQILTNEIHYAQEILAGAEFVIQNLPAVLANLPANIQAAIQALLTFDPVPVIQQFIAHQLTYAQIIATSLQNAAHDFVVGLEELPAAFQSAVQALLAGDINGAVRDIADGFLGLFFNGVHEDISGDPLTPPGLTVTVTPGGTVGDLLPILTIPGMVAQDFTNLLPAGSIPARIAQNVTNVIDTLLDTSIKIDALLALNMLSATATAKLGLPAALLIDAVGAPLNAMDALGSSATAFIGDLQTGNAAGAIGTLIDAPAVVANAFLNGRSTLALSFNVPDFTETLPPTTIFGQTFQNSITLRNGTADFNIPLDGILVPQTTMTASFNGTASGSGPTGILAATALSLILPLDNIVVGGTPTSGLATGLLVSAPEALALAITP